MADLFFLVVLALIPVQTNKFFFLNYSYVFGIPIDYRAASIYLVDIFLVFYLIAFLLTERKNLKKSFNSKKPYFYSLTALFTYLILDSIFFSGSKTASIIFSAKIGLFCLFAAFAAVTLEKANIWSKVTKVLAFSIVWEFVLAALEFTNQHSLNLWFLGERTFDTTTTSIAHINIFGNLLLRPYGTFPHPNVLGMFFVIYLTLYLSGQISSPKLKNLAKNPILILGLIGVLISFSKDAALSIFAAYTFLAQKTSQFFLRAVIFLAVAAIIAKYVAESDVSSVAERILLLQASLNISSKSVLFGVGANNFIPKLAEFNITSLSAARLLQPVHNVFLLILSENGIIGLIFFVIFLSTVLKYLDRPYKFALFIVILIGLVLDHFFWTLEQAQLLFFLATAAIAAAPKFNVPNRKK